MEVLNESVKVLHYPPLLHKKNKIYYWGDVLYCILAYGALPEDYVSLKFYEKSRKERGKYVTAGNKRLFYKKFYDDEARKTLANKSLFSKKFHEFVKRDWLYTPDVAIDEVETFVRRHGKVIVKPNSSTWGMGISVVDATKMEELLNEIRNGKQFMIEEVLENHPDVRMLNPSSLQTLRVETCIDSQGGFHLLNVLLMMGTTKTIVSNCHSGGIMCHVDVRTGKIDREGWNPVGLSYAVHPASQIPLIDFEVPFVKEQLEDYIKKVARVMPNARYVGWDVAMTPNGLELIEGNFCPGQCTQTCDGVPKYDMLKSYM